MSERVTISMELDLKEKLDKISDLTELSVSNLVRRCILESIDDISKRFAIKEVPTS